jgi:hypothetical protein
MSGAGVPFEDCYRSPSQGNHYREKKPLRPADCHIRHALHINGRKR